jgi:hypothetical protein
MRMKPFQIWLEYSCCIEEHHRFKVCRPRLDLSMSDDNKRYCGGWINQQPELFPWLEEEIDPVTARLERLIILFDILRRCL